MDAMFADHIEHGFALYQGCIVIVQDRKVGYIRLQAEGVYMSAVNRVGHLVHVNALTGPAISWCFGELERDLCNFLPWFKGGPLHFCGNVACCVFLWPGSMPGTIVNDSTYAQLRVVRERVRDPAKGLGYSTFFVGRSFQDCVAQYTTACRFVDRDKNRIHPNYFEVAESEGCFHADPRSGSVYMDYDVATQDPERVMLALTHCNRNFTFPGHVFFAFIRPYTRADAFVFLSHGHVEEVASGLEYKSAYGYLDLFRLSPTGIPDPAWRATLLH